MTAVPRDYISEHFRPEAKLVALSRKSDLDELQNKVVRLVTFLSRISGVPFRRFGVTGSILIDIHNPAFSDMDITVYGVENSYEVKEGLTKSCSTSDSIGRFKGEKLRNWCRRKATHYPITAIEAERIYERKWNMGIYEGTFFSVHPVKLEAELAEEYGDKTYCPAGDITIQAVIADSKDSIFLPAVYQVKDVEAAGNIEPSIEEVVSYEGLYDSLGEKGEQICVKGKLEHVTDHRTGRTYARVLVGSPEGKGREYIKRSP
jgi:predicted nucleotidyltransferase